MAGSGTSSVNQSPIARSLQEAQSERAPAQRFVFPIAATGRSPDPHCGVPMVMVGLPEPEMFVF